MIFLDYYIFLTTYYFWLAPRIHTKSDVSRIDLFLGWLIVIIWSIGWIIFRFDNLISYFRNDWEKYKNKI